MTDRTPKDDLKEGLGLLFRAAKGIAKDVSADKAEKAMYDGGNELVRVLSKVGKTVGDELSKAFQEKETSRAEHPAPTPADRPKDEDGADTTAASAPDTTAASAPDTTAASAPGSTTARDPGPERSEPPPEKTG